ncbi:MAG: ATP-dependent ligase [Actinomycetia bacterium]|nr:ATP-dependent ligase [Actinomycetes bacterium]
MGRPYPGAVLLNVVVETSEAVGATRSRRAKIEALATVLRACAPDEIATVVNLLTGEPRQGRIGVGWATLSAVRRAAEASTTPGDDSDGAALQPVHVPEPNVTVAELDAALHRVAATTGSGSAGARRQILVDLFARATPAEADFVVRLLTGELRQGALAGLMADAIARAGGVPATTVRRAAMLGGDLADTARRALTGGEAALVEVGLEVLRPVQPMLAASAATVAEALAATGRASVEWKLDGARIQVHRADGEVRAFTRNLNDVTARVPEVVEVVRAFPAREFVLDGEAIGLTDDALPRRFQDTMSRFGTDDATSHAMTLAPFFFDVLHLDGEDLLDRPLGERAAILAGLVGEWRVPAVETDDPEVAEAFLADALATGHEGVMVKALDSRYEAGRRGAAWRKVKPVKTLDLVVLAAEWGHGRRQGWLSNLHLGARDPETGEFVMVGKTFKGLTDELLTWQTQRLQEIEAHHDDYTVYVRPELVVEIALDGAQVSTRYAGGVALRFARVRAYRPDKAAADADTIDAVRALLAP